MVPGHVTSGERGLSGRGTARPGAKGQFFPRERGEASPARRPLPAADEFRTPPTRISPKLEIFRPGQQSAARPSGQLVAVVLQLGGNDGPSLRVQLLTPVNAVTVLQEASPGTGVKGGLLLPEAWDLLQQRRNSSVGLGSGGIRR